MKIFLRILGIILFVSIISFSMTSCDFFKEKDCSHCGGTGEPCTYISGVCDYCPQWDSVMEKWECGVCSGTGKVPDW